MTSPDSMRACLDAVTANAARALGLWDRGLAAGRDADLVLLQARDPIEAIRLRATRLAVVRRGRVVARAAPRVTHFFLEGRPDTLNLAA